MPDIKERHREEAEFYADKLNRGGFSTPDKYGKHSYAQGLADFEAKVANWLVIVTDPAWNKHDCTAPDLETFKLIKRIAKEIESGMVLNNE